MKSNVSVSNLVKDGLNKEVAVLALKSTIYRSKKPRKSVNYGRYPMIRFAEEPETQHQLKTVPFFQTYMSSQLGMYIGFLHCVRSADSEELEQYSNSTIHCR